MNSTFRLRASLLLVSIVVGFLFSAFGLTDKVDRWNMDVYHVILGTHYTPADTAIAALDEDALAYYPDTPLPFWGPHLARAIERLKGYGARAVILDLYLLITPEQWLRTLGKDAVIPSSLVDYDQSFDAALARGGVVLAAKPVRNQSGIVVSPPAQEYLEALPNNLEDVGLASLIFDSDGFVRRFIPALEAEIPGSAGTAYAVPDPWWSLSALAIKAADGETYLRQLVGNDFKEARHISYCGPPGTIPRISLAALFRETGLTLEEQRLVQGRIVFIGVDTDVFSDRQPTPYSRQFMGLGHRDMSCVEIHANITETMLHPQRLHTVPLWVAILVWMPLIVPTISFAEKHSRLKRLGCIDLMLNLVIWSVGIVAFQYGIVLPFAGIFTAMAAYFMLVVTVDLFVETEYGRKVVRIIFGSSSLR